MGEQVLGRRKLFRKNKMKPWCGREGVHGGKLEAHGAKMPTSCRYSSCSASKSKAVTFVTYTAPVSSLRVRCVRSINHICSSCLCIFSWLSLGANTPHTWPLVGKLLFWMVLRTLHSAESLPPSKRYHLRTSNNIRNGKSGLLYWKQQLLTLPLSCWQHQWCDCWD